MKPAFDTIIFKGTKTTDQQVRPIKPRQALNKTANKSKRTNIVSQSERHS